MTGLLRVCAAVTPDGDRQVATLLPNGAEFMLPLEAAMTYAFALIACARDQFPSREQVDAAAISAYDRHRELLIGRRTQ
jgi:hypothetical protein